MPQTIELDCAPFTGRPAIADVIAGTGLPDREPDTKFFGNWIWDYSDIPADHWARIQPTLKARITTLYENGQIRYGSW